MMPAVLVAAVAAKLLQVHINLSLSYFLKYVN